MTTERPLEVALVGASSLMGREVARRLERQRPRPRVSLHEPSGEHAILRPFGEEVIATTPLSPAALEVADVVLVCDLLDAGASELLQASATRLPVVDLTGQVAGLTLDARRGARIVGLRPGMYSSPAASSLLTAALVRAAREAGATAPVVVTILEPASELGDAAVNEMFQQAVSLLNFSTLPMAVFGRQAVHDVVSPGPLGRQREARLRREIEALCGERVPLLVLCPGLFHGTGAAARAEVDAGAWRARLAAQPGLSMSDADDETASPVSVVKQECASVGRIEADEAGGAWAWAAADTLTWGSVGNAVALFSETSS